MKVELKNTTHNTDGVYRCCLQSWSNLCHETPTKEFSLGETIKCAYCKRKSILREIHHGNPLTGFFHQDSSTEPEQD